MEKSEALNSAVAQIEKQFGKGAIMRMGDMPLANIDYIPTGSLALDVALGIGGLPKGRIVEIFGPEASGKTTLLYHVMAQAQRRGIVTEVFESETFDNALGRTVERVCRGSPLAARINKRQIRDFLDQAAPPSLAERREFYKFANSDDYRAGRVAFLQKGTPVFTGT